MNETTCLLNNLLQLSQFYFVKIVIIEVNCSTNMLFHSFTLSVYDNLFKRCIYYCLYLPISSMLRLLWQNSAGSVKQTPVNDVMMEISICQICSDVINKVVLNLRRNSKSYVNWFMVSLTTFET